VIAKGRTVKEQKLNYTYLNTGDDTENQHTIPSLSPALIFLFFWMNIASLLLLSTFQAIAVPVVKKVLKK
jgi:hypothetical protein